MDLDGSGDFGGDDAGHDVPPAHPVAEALRYREQQEAQHHREGDVGVAQFLGRDDGVSRVEMKQAHDHGDRGRNFPSPANPGDTYEPGNGITYTYNSTKTVWTRVTNGTVTSGNMTVTQLNVGTSVGLTNTEAYDLDDVTNYVDGRTNTFTLKYNGSTITVNNAWNLDVSVNGAKQPAFKYNGDLVWLSATLPANRGYCLDYSGNLRFADALPLGSAVTVSTKPGTNSQSTKKYPFNPLDIVLGM